jgi:hypothetical protein
MSIVASRFLCQVAQLFITKTFLAVLIFLASCYHLYCVTYCGLSLALMSELAVYIFTSLWVSTNLMIFDFYNLCYPQIWSWGALNRYKLSVFGYYNFWSELLSSILQSSRKCLSGWLVASDHYISSNNSSHHWLLILVVHFSVGSFILALSFDLRFSVRSFLCSPIALLYSFAHIFFWNAFLLFIRFNT